jgi:hypothetical protein
MGVVAVIHGALPAACWSSSRCISAHNRGFHLFLAGFLLFALGVIGLYAQGQLSVVNMHARQGPPVRLAQAYRRLRQPLPALQEPLRSRRPRFSGQAPIRLEIDQWL